MSERDFYSRPRLGKFGGALIVSNIGCVRLRREFLKRYAEITGPGQPWLHNCLGAVHDDSAPRIRNEHRGFGTAMN